MVFVLSPSDQETTFHFWLLNQPGKKKVVVNLDAVCSIPYAISQNRAAKNFWKRPIKKEVKKSNDSMSRDVGALQHLLLLCF